MTRKIISWLTPMLAAMVLGGCDEGPASVSHFDRGAVWSTFAESVKEGPALVRIHGDPFSGSRDFLVSTVLKAMGQAIQKRKTRFTTDPKSAPRPDYRVVLAFNPPVSLDGRRLCQGDKPASAVEEGKINILAAFCVKAELYSEVTGWVRNVEAPDSERFGKLISQVTRDLLDRGD